MKPVDPVPPENHVEETLPQSLHGWGWYAVLVIICAVLLPQVTSWGMFLDGTTYASISRNLSIGLGTWWSPYYTATLFPQFHEHPPLGFILQSAFFHVAGDHYLVEKVYSFVIMVCTLLLLWRTWGRLADRVDASGLRSLGWLPALLWVTIPQWNWTYKSNMLENTMAFFCLLSFYLVIRAMDARQRSLTVLFAALASVALAAAFLTKGPASLFPLAAPALMAFALRRPGPQKPLLRGAAVTVILGSFLLLLFACLATFEPLCVSFGTYFSQQLLPSLSGERHTAGARGTIIRSLAENTGPMASVLLVCIVISLCKRKPLDGLRRALPVGFGCILVGVSGSIPLLLSHKARSFYLVPSFPVFALGFAMLVAGLLTSTCRPPVRTQSSRANSIYARGPLVLLLLALAAWSVSLVGTPQKDREIHRQLSALKTVIPSRTTIGGDSTLCTNWSFHAFLIRYLIVSLDTGQSSVSRDFFLLPPGTPPPVDFEDTGLTFGNCLLLKKTTSSHDQPRRDGGGEQGS